MGSTLLPTLAPRLLGAVAVALLAARGFEVTAVTGRPETQEYLSSLGASAFLTREEMSDKARRLDAETWAGAVDTVGSAMLAQVVVGSTSVSLTPGVSMMVVRPDVAMLQVVVTLLNAR